MTYDPELFRAHNVGVYQARAVYYSQPISSPSYHCRRCTGYGYEPRVLCDDCEKRDRARRAAWEKTRYQTRKKGATA